jgi:hypothetical protein
LDEGGQAPQKAAFCRFQTIFLGTAEGFLSSKDRRIAIRARSAWQPFDLDA